MRINITQVVKYLSTALMHVPVHTTHGQQLGQAGPHLQG